jgi:hypothetical protein
MSDIIGDDAAHSEWRQLCQAALFETNPVTLLERIAHARNGVLRSVHDYTNFLSTMAVPQRKISG